jgi:hypothetical protein
MTVRHSKDGGFVAAERVQIVDSVRLGLDEIDDTKTMRGSMCTATATFIVCTSILHPSRRQAKEVEKLQEYAAREVWSEEP